MRNPSRGRGVQVLDRSFGFSSSSLPHDFFVDRLILKDDHLLPEGVGGRMAEYLTPIRSPNSRSAFSPKGTSMDLAVTSIPGLLKMHSAVREALETDDALQLVGLQTGYRVRDTPDWRAWSDSLESELDKRSVKYTKADW
jgi:hypothetical protein